jgi:hypothetical protein
MRTTFLRTTSLSDGGSDEFDERLVAIILSPRRQQVARNRRDGHGERGEDARATGRRCGVNRRSKSPFRREIVPHLWQVTMLVPHCIRAKVLRDLTEKHVDPRRIARSVTPLAASATTVEPGTMRP